MDFHISPNYIHTKLEHPSFEDLVDVFEDRFRAGLFRPVAELLKIGSCESAAIGILITYFESIEIYRSGEDSRSRAEEFFIRAFVRVFQAAVKDPATLQKIARQLYKEARCGFMHEAMFRASIIITDQAESPILATFPKRGELIIEEGEIASLVVCPAKILESIETHFDRYISMLREDKNETVRAAFLMAVKLKWGLDDEPPIVGMSEAEFWGKS